MVFDSGPSAVKFPVSRSSTTHIYLLVTTGASSPANASNFEKLEAVEENIEKVARWHETLVIQFCEVLQCCEVLLEVLKEMVLIDFNCLVMD
ncbi:hypothetical protein Q3G72_000535 [Acer saccharum]|nr:hypothetical protein Q3G72_000535 [Acer saccharum]